jgi:hypothetical protein
VAHYPERVSRAFLAYDRKELTPMNDRNAPATKGDIADSGQRLEQRLVETMRDIETKLLQAFYGDGKSNDQRVLEVETNESLLRTRLATLESRIMEVERRLNIPPIQ